MQDQKEEIYLKNTLIPTKDILITGTRLLYLGGLASFLSFCVSWTTKMCFRFMVFYAIKQCTMWKKNQF